MEDLIPGDVVCLNSSKIYDNPIRMTIATINDGIAKCQWFDNLNNLRDGEFPLTSLTKI